MNWLGARFFEQRQLAGAGLPQIRPGTFKKPWLLPATEYILDHLTPRGGEKHKSTVAQLHAFSGEVAEAVAEAVAEKLLNYSDAGGCCVPARLLPT